MCESDESESCSLVELAAVPEIKSGVYTSGVVFAERDTIPERESEDGCMFLLGERHSESSLNWKIIILFSGDKDTVIPDSCSGEYMPCPDVVRADEQVGTDGSACLRRHESGSACQFEKNGCLLGSLNIPIFIFPLFLFGFGSLVIDNRLNIRPRILEPCPLCVPQDNHFLVLEDHCALYARTCT